MEKLTVLILSLLLLSCDQKMKDEAIIACNCTNPQENLPWLKDLIQKAETDSTSNYLGCIWLEKTSNGKDVFVTNMMLGSGGILYWVFDCDGNHLALSGVEKCVACEYVGNRHFYLDDDSLPPLSEMKKDIVIYAPQNLQSICE